MRRGTTAFIGRSLVFGACVMLAPAVFAQQDRHEIPRTPEGRPDLSVTYDIATLTPLQRPAKFGERLTLTAEESAVAQTEPNGIVQVFGLAPAGSDERNERSATDASDPDREAPPIGGDGSAGAAGNVGGYNTFWVDRGNAAFQIDGAWRTSIITSPGNGRRPPLTQPAPAAQAERAAFFRPNTGTAWWLENDLDASGPYDDPELRPLAERCLLGFGSTSGPPMLPVLYNNLKKIVQTEDHVMIFVEMVHDARIVRMDQEHLPSDIRRWLGDSVGHWEGDTLIVDTTNFNDSPGLGGASRNLHVIEEFTPLDADTLLYRFTVDDPTIWTEPWTGEYVWPATDERSTSTPVTRRTTPLAVFFAAPDCSRTTPAPRRSRSLGTTVQDRVTDEVIEQHITGVRR